MYRIRGMDVGEIIVYLGNVKKFGYLVYEKRMRLKKVRGFIKKKFLCQLEDLGFYYICDVEILKDFRQGSDRIRFSY